MIVMVGDEKREKEDEKLKIGLTGRKKGGDSKDDEGWTELSSG